MNTVSYNAFTENSKLYLDGIVASNQEIVILKDKKPVFKVLPINTNNSSNLLKDSILFEADIVSPISDTWEAE